MHQTLPSASRPASKPERRATRATQLQKTLPLNALLRRLYLQPLCFEDFANTKRVPPSVTSVYSRLCSPALEKFIRRATRSGGIPLCPYSRLGNYKNYVGTAALCCPAARVSGHSFGSQDKGSATNQSTCWLYIHICTYIIVHENVPEGTLFHTAFVFL